MFAWVTDPADPTFWVAAALLIFVGALIWKRVPGAAGKALDERAARIEAELEEARRLREEAQELLAQRQRSQLEAETEAEEIIAQAKKEANLAADEARVRLAEQIERRTAMAEAKIDQARNQAEARVRAAAADLAVEAAERVLTDTLDDKTRGKLFDDSVKDLEKRLN